jgi:hypothetical protein
MSAASRQRRLNQAVQSSLTRRGGGLVNLNPALKGRAKFIHR